MMARIGSKLIAICSAAIGIIYAAGYVVTESTAAALNPIGITADQPTASNIPEATSSPEIIESPTALPSAKPQMLKSTTTRTALPTASITPTAQPTPDPTPKVTPKATSKATPKASSKATPVPTLAPTATPEASASPIPTPIVQNQKYHDGTFSGSGTNRFGTVAVAVTIKKGEITNVDITRSRTSYPKSYIDPLPAEVIDAQDYNIDTVSGATRSSEDFIYAVREALLQAERSN